MSQHQIVILIVLAKIGEMSGVEILSTLKGTWTIKKELLYISIGRLVAKRMVTRVETVTSGNRRSKVCTITDAGRERLGQELLSMRKLLDIESFLSPDPK